MAIPYAVSGSEDLRCLARRPNLAVDRGSCYETISRAGEQSINLFSNEKTGRSFDLTGPERFAADCAAVGVDLSVREYEKQALCHGTQRLAFGTVDFGSAQFVELLLHDLISQMRQ